MQRPAPLSRQLVVYSAAQVTVVVCVITAIFVALYQNGLEQAASEQARTLHIALQDKGMAVARNAALSSQRAVAVMDYLFLTEVIQTTVAHDPEVVYGVIMDRERRAVVHSDPAAAGTVLSDPAALFAATQTQVTTQDLTVQGQKILEVVAPIGSDAERWGCIRFGLSTKRLDAAVVQAENLSRQQIRFGIVAVLAAGVILAFFGSTMGVMTARRVVKPLQTLAQSAMRIRDGDFDHSVQVQRGSQEVNQLAEAFNEMTRGIRDRDVALRRSMEELSQALARAEEAVRLKSEFLANISHELRTPLNAICNVPGMLVAQYQEHTVLQCTSCGATFRRPDHDEIPQTCPECRGVLESQNRLHIAGDLREHRKFLRRLDTSANHLLQLVNDLLDFSKLEAGRMNLHVDRVDLPALIQELDSTLSILANAKGVQLEYGDMSPGEALVADYLKVKQVLVNVIGNAIKFTPPKGSVVLSVQRSDTAFHFKITDTGVGIPADQFETIFESFRQVDSSHTRNHGGTGLGLAICRQLMELHGGRIWVDSKLGQGSVFHLTFPLPQEAAMDSDKGRSA